jgi:hypothetical protein
VKALYILSGTLQNSRDGLLITHSSAPDPPRRLGKCWLERTILSDLFLSAFQSKLISARPGAKTTNLGVTARMEAGAEPRQEVTGTIAYTSGPRTVGGAPAARPEKWRVPRAPWGCTEGHPVTAKFP